MNQNKIAKIFISHGHNELLKLKLKNFIAERLGLYPVILAEQPDLGLTIIEKLEKYGKDCDFALIILTADDQTVNGGIRARQNVIHELGFFHGILGRDKVLLLKQFNVELFANISGLIYKEFEDDKIESIFEDIRFAIETGSAQSRGESVPKKKTDDSEEFSSKISKSIDVVTYEWPKIERRNLLDEMKMITKGLAEDMQVKRVKKFLEDKRKDYEKRLSEAEAEAEKSKETFKADPDHGGKMAAMILSISTTIAPKSTIGFIDKLLNEISFLDSNNVKAQDIINRIIGLFDEEQ
ncbi:hypothetical protein CEE36_06080 [candidate division TA06 bacterium B3_TA06]|uniref:CD-NTase-associated protein 12/Pycsar effector protein TIR domain-containing protein n=1 Tax=candidate division TA06 bacterium B3_TA06 TaxID=2012487 RepID=A0A532V6L2_UNCT6|nr:MAG: hypothetical protein CEE36_06080 [candidate division TA06 bacterium B3_TA06]